METDVRTGSNRDWVILFSIKRTLAVAHDSDLTAKKPVAIARGSDLTEENPVAIARGTDSNVAAGYPKFSDIDAGGAGKVHINKTSWFENVPEKVWNFHIGGYQVCHKWLKDRKGRTLSAEDIAHYGKITIALAETIRLMNEIDETIEDHGGFPLAGSQ